MIDSTVTRLVAILAENFGIEETTTTAGTELETLEFDSLVYVELSLALAREFDVTIDDEEMAEKQTVGELADLLDTALIAAGRAVSADAR